MTNEEFNELFRKRTLDFAINVLKYVETISATPAARVVTYQLGKASTSIGANFRAFCRGRSRNERFAKICIVVEEADETEYWLSVTLEMGYGNHDLNFHLLNESTEIVKIVSKIKNKISS